MKLQNLPSPLASLPEGALHIATSLSPRPACGDKGTLEAEQRVRERGRGFPTLSLTLSRPKAGEGIPLTFHRS